MSGKECHQLEEHVKGQEEHTQKVPNGYNGKEVGNE